jgi:antitoxin (DNA-binding transcriptional repressor) of toxin-antitoxin stability system
MITATKSQVRKYFGEMMEQVSRGTTITILSKGRPVATINPVRQNLDKEMATKKLYDHMAQIESTGIEKWKREDLYERDSK